MFLAVVVVLGIGTQDYQRAAAATNIDISGIIYDIDLIEYACGSNGSLTVRVRVNGAGAYSGTCTDDTGAYAVTGVSVNPSDVVTVFVDDATVHASYVTKAAASPSNMTLDLAQDVVSLGHADAGPITNADLDQYDSEQNSNIGFTVSANALSNLFSSQIFVTAGTTYSPGGTVTVTNNYIVANTGSVVTLATSGNTMYGIQATGGTMRINGDTTVSGGGLTNAGGTITTTAGTPTLTVSGTCGTINGSMTLYNLTLSAAGTCILFSGGDTLTINNNFTINTGVTVDQRSNVVISGNLITSGTGALLSGGSTPTTTVNGTSLGGGAGSVSFYNFAKTSAGTTTWSGTTMATVTNALTVSAGTLSFTGGSLILGGSVTTSGGTLTGTGSITYAATSGVTIPASGSYGNLAVSDGLVGYWKLDETSGTTAADSSGLGHTGTHTATPTISSDVPTLQYANPQSLDFDGSSNYVDLGRPAFLNSQFAGKISLSAWIKPDVSKTAVIVGKSDNQDHNAPYYDYSLFQFGNILNFRIGSANISSSGSGTGALVVNGTTWQHVAGTYDGTTLRAYINGVEVASQVSAGLAIASSARNTRIGARDTTVMDEFFNGKIDDVRIYRRGLTAQEIQSLRTGFHIGTSAATFTLGGNLDVNGDLTIASGALDADNAQNYSLNVSGSFQNYGVLIPRSGAVVLDGGSGGKVIESGQQRFHNLTIAGSGGSWTLRDRLWVTGTLGISNGTIDVSSSNYTVHAGTLNQSGGTFTAQTGTVVLDAASSQTVSVTSTVNNLRLEDPTISNLAGYWKLDEGSGLTAKDSSGNSRDGVLTNAPAPTTSLNGTTTYDNVAGLDVDGTDDYVTMGDVIDADDTASLTISGWFNRDTATTDDVIVAKRNGNTASDVGYIVWLDAASDKLRFEASDGTDEFELASVSTFTSTGWNHFVVIWDQASAVNSKIYINGSDNSATQTGTIGNVNDLSNSLALRLGAESDADAPFDGKIDDIRIFSSAVTAAQATALGAGKYADGTAGTATFTLGAALVVGGTLTLDSGTLSTSSSVLTVTNAFTLAVGNGAYLGGTQTQTLNGGLTVSGSSFTGGAGTLDLNGSATLSGGSVMTGSGTWTVSGNFTHSGATFTASAGHTLTMDGTGTLTSNGQTLQNLSIVSSGTVTLAGATHTVAGNVVLGGSGTPTVTGSTVSMTGTANTIDGGGKTLANLTIDPATTGTITLQNSDLVVSELLSIATSDTLLINSGRTVTLSANSGTSLILNGTISGTGRLEYRNSATVFPSTGIVSSVVRFGQFEAAIMNVPARTFGSDLELYTQNGDGSIDLGTGAGQTLTVAGSLFFVDGDAQAQYIFGNTYNPNINIAGSVDFTGFGGPTRYVYSGSGAWTVGGNIDFTGGTLSTSAGNTFTMTGTSATLTPAAQTFVNLTIDPSTAGTISVSGSDGTVSGLLTVAANDTFSLGANRTMVLSGNSGTTLSVNGTISGAGRLTYQNSATTLTTSGTLSSIMRFDTVNGAMIIPARTYGGQVEVYGASANARTVTLGTGASQTITINGNLYVMAEAASPNHITITGVTNNPAVVIGGALDYTGVGAANEIILSGTGTWTVSGNVDFTSGTYTSTAGNTLTMDGASATITSASQTLYNLSVHPATTGTVTTAGTNISVTNTLSVGSTGILSIGSGLQILVLGTTNPQGTIDGAGTLYVTGSLGTGGTVSSNVTFDASSAPLTVPTRIFSGSTRTVRFYSENNTTTIGNASGTITIAGSVIFDDGGNGGITFTAATNNPNITIGGDLTAVGYGDIPLLLGAGTWTVGGNLDFTGITSLTPGASTIVMTGASKTFTSVGLSVNSVEISGTITAADAITANGNFTIQSGGVFTAPSAMTLKGNFDNNGSFTHSNGTVTFAATTTGKTIECGSSSLYNVILNHAAGGWIMQTNDCVIAHDFLLSAASNFTLVSGRTLTISGTFTNNVGGNATTWTGSTLYLTSTGTVALNTKSVGDDSYGTLRVGSAAQATMWNSDATTVSVDVGGGLLSQDHAAVDGQLYVYGTMNSRTNEYWSAEKDFDGTALGAGRQTNVRFADGATFVVDVGDTLQILGVSPTSQRVSLDRQSTGSFGLTINGTIQAKYFDIDHLQTSGLTIASTATVVELSYGSFDNSAGGTNATYITIDGATTTASLTDLVFDARADGLDGVIVSNIRATGSGIVWTLLSAAGAKRGPVYEHEASGASITWDSPTISLNDGTGSDIDLVNQTEELSANWTLSSTTAVDHLMFAIGTSVGGDQALGFTSVGSALAVSIDSLSLQSGTTYYTALRAVDQQGEIISEASSDGVLVDASAPALTDLTIITSTTMATVTWTTDEPATSQVEHGLTTSLGTSTTLDSTLTTSHQVELSNLVAGSSYYLRAYSVDQAGNTGASVVSAFSVSNKKVGGRAAGPTLRQPILEGGTTPAITVVGFAHGTQAVRIFLDGKRVITIRLPGARTTVVQFYRRISLVGVAIGRHTLTAQTVNVDGTTSRVTKAQVFTVRRVDGKTRVLTTTATQYRVVAGDSLWSIAQTFLGNGRRFQEIVSANAKRFPTITIQPYRVVLNWILALPAY